MEPGVVNTMLGLVGQQVLDIIGALVPYAEGLLDSLLKLAIVTFGINMMAAGANVLTGPLIYMIAFGAGAKWLIGYWSELLTSTLEWCRLMISGMSGGAYDGPASLVTMGSTISQAIVTHGPKMRLNLLSFGADTLLSLFNCFIIEISFVLMSVMATVAQVEFLLVGALAPALLPFAAFRGTLSIGTGPLRALLVGSLNVLGGGVTAIVVMNAITQVVVVPGQNATLTTTDVQIIAALALTGAFITWRGLSFGSRLASGFASGGSGASVMAAGSAASSAARSASGGSRATG